MTTRPWALGGLVLAASLVPAPSFAQSTADTVSVFEAVLAARIGVGLTGPAGPVASICGVTTSVPLFAVRGGERSPFLTDTLPELTPRLKGIVARILRQRHGLSIAENCEKFIDESGRQGAYLDLSAPRFYGESTVVVYSAIRLGNLWGSGGRCRWERSGSRGEWSRGGDCLTWDSD